LKRLMFTGVLMILIPILVGCSQPSLEGGDESSETQVLIDRPDVFWADPNVIQSCDDDVGRTTVYWKVPESSSVEIHVNSPDGALFAEGGSEGSAETKDWVKDRMVFYLLDSSDHKVIATCRVRVTRAGCPETEGE